MGCTACHSKKDIGYQHHGMTGSQQKETRQGQEWNKANIARRIDEGLWPSCRSPLYFCIEWYFEALNTIQWNRVVFFIYCFNLPLVITGHWNFLEFKPDLAPTLITEQKALCLVYLPSVRLPIAFTLFGHVWWIVMVAITSRYVAFYCLNNF